MNHLMHGKGTYKWVNGEVFIGNYVNGKRDGQGTTLFSDGTVRNAEYTDGQINTNQIVKEQYPNGDTYEGELEN